MLVLKRQKNERIAIDAPNGDRIWISVAGLDRGAARIAIEAPTNYNIAREELIPQPGVNHDGGPDRKDGAPSDGWIDEGKTHGKTSDTETGVPGAGLQSPGNSPRPLQFLPTTSRKSRRAR